MGVVGFDYIRKVEVLVWEDMWGCVWVCSVGGNCFGILSWLFGFFGNEGCVVVGGGVGGGGWVGGLGCLGGG